MKLSICQLFGWNVCFRGSIVTTWATFQNTWQKNRLGLPYHTLQDQQPFPSCHIWFLLWRFDWRILRLYRSDCHKIRLNYVPRTAISLWMNCRQLEVCCWNALAWKMKKKKPVFSTNESLSRTLSKIRTPKYENGIIQKTKSIQWTRFCFSFIQVAW